MTVLFSVKRLRNCFNRPISLLDAGQGQYYNLNLMEWYASIKLADLSEQTDDNLIVTDYLNKFPDEGFRGFEVRYTHSPTIILK